MKWKSPIPKHIHFIWIGTSKIPDYFTKYFLKSFKENMPDFTFRIWTNKDLTKKNFPKTYAYIQQAKKLHNQPAFEYSDDGEELIIIDKDDKQVLYNKWAQMTDLMRVEIIHNLGGYYFDINFEILPPRRKHTLYHLLNSTKKKFVGCNETKWCLDVPHLSNSFFGSTKGNPILKRLLTKSYLNSIDFESIQVANETGPGYLREGIYPKDSYHIFPSYYFYPFIEDPGFENCGPGRQIKPNKCHKRKTKKKSYKKLQKKKGFIEFPCKKYPRSYALKHWQLGKSWLSGWAS